MQNTRTRIRCLIVSMLVLGHAAAAAELHYGKYDHYDPARLNEFAARKMREGDPGTAMVLLERAALLAPHDVRIRRNLETLRAWQAGEPAVEEAAGPARRPASAEDGLPPFPLWPKRQP